MTKSGTTNVRRLVVVLGDQLDYQRYCPNDFNPHQDMFWMAEATEESTHVLSNKHRIVFFLSSMRHFRDYLGVQNLPLIYHELASDGTDSSLSSILEADINRLKPQEIYLKQPGDYRVRTSLIKVIEKLGVPLTIAEDESFLCSQEQFSDHASNRKVLRLEFFYREIRRRHNILIDNDKPVGGEWNFDKNNRESFGKKGPPSIPENQGTKPDKITQEVIQFVDARFTDHPGNLDNFNWPVTPNDAEAQLDHFIDQCLPLYGRFQDAMWTGQNTLFHSLVAAPLNLRLLDPLKVVRKVETAYYEERAPIAAVEGFIRQVVGWREYVRGIYNLHMPNYRTHNHLKADIPLPSFFWSGKTDMACMSSCLTQVLETGYGHHIQRLMVIGLYSLLIGVRPEEINDWFLASYVDAVDWVTTPNVIGMSQFAAGGLMASKPYSATGAYINRMSNYCASCRYNPKESTGPNACPFTSSYWAFLDRHRETLSSNQRMSMQLRNLSRMDDQRLKDIRKAADSHLHQL